MTDTTLNINYYFFMIVHLVSLRTFRILKKKRESSKGFPIIEHLSNTRVLYKRPRNIGPDGKTEACRDEEKTAALTLTPALCFF